MIMVFFRKCAWSDEGFVIVTCPVPSLKTAGSLFSSGFSGGEELLCAWEPLGLRPAVIVGWGSYAWNGLVVRACVGIGCERAVVAAFANGRADEGAPYRFGWIEEEAFTEWN